MSIKARDIFIRRLREDLIGPAEGETEILNERPSDRYLTGILYPQNERMAAEDDDSLDVQSGKENENEKSEEIAIVKSFKPAAAGISFSVVSESGLPTINVTLSCGLYNPVWTDFDGAKHTEKPKNPQKMEWVRRPILLTIPIDIEAGTTEIDLAEHGLPTVFLYVKVSYYGEVSNITLQAYNANMFEATAPFYKKEAGALFQFKMAVTPKQGTRLAPRPVKGYISDDDTKIAALIYRNIKEYATGHTCAAVWTEEDGIVTALETSWMPQQKVFSTDASGDDVFKYAYEEAGLSFPTAWFLSHAGQGGAIKSLQVLVDAFETWLDQQEIETKKLKDTILIEQAQKNIKDTRLKAIGRMNEGIRLLQTNESAFLAFVLANRAMQIQSCWKKGMPNGEPLSDEAHLRWRPFQLAFYLLTLPSLINRSSADREIMDLIWFPTGGGKTEAYLLITAFTLFFRRLSVKDKAVASGVAAFMRYTLRTLTVQQFERAAALITACEIVRVSDPSLIVMLGEKRFSIGLWVGSDSTPNKYDDAEKSMANINDGVTPAQIKKCPACKGDLEWRCDEPRRVVVAQCNTTGCIVKTKLEEMPVITVDDHLYAELPTLIIGTIDKFAQIVRNEQAVRLFGVGTAHNPPDLIIQDELHLISGPLGTIAGIYEIAIDKFCSLNGYKPKIIGSTATIRRAKEQVRALFDREAYQFPPPILDADNSCFAKTDFDSPGRLYLGITTAGRSQKFVLQAVAASLLQSLQDAGATAKEKDAFSTLVSYFNSLRILGGALVVMQDDVDKTVKAFAARRNEEKRAADAPEEMTSRKKSKEIPEILNRLELHKGDTGFIDVLLATNMLSVGVDIPRLGLMMVAGQPKTMSEYIQATSRVGRQDVPGLIVTIYNNNKIRDRTHYENFTTWHQSLYRELEGSSVTPFAARARDKALHAPLIVLARHMIADLRSNPVLKPAFREEIEKKIIPFILNRVDTIDEREAESTERQLEEILDCWQNYDGLKYYWNPHRKGSLLVSADDVAQLYAAYNKKGEGIATPNTMRNVEAQATFFLKESAKPFEDRTNKNG